MFEAKLVRELEDGREIYEVDAPLNRQVSALRNKGIKEPYLVTPEESVLIKLNGIHSAFSRTSYAPAKVKGKPTIVTANSPYMSEAMAVVAMDAHRKKKYPSLSSAFYCALKDMAKDQKTLAPEDRTVHIMEGKPNSEGLIALTPKMDDTKFLLKKLTKPYFRRLELNQIFFEDLLDDIPEGKTIVNYLRFHGIYNISLSARNVFFSARFMDFCEHGFSCSFGILEKKALKIL